MNSYKTQYIHVRASAADLRNLAELAEKMQVTESEAARQAVKAALEAARNQPQPQAAQADH